MAQDNLNEVLHDFGMQNSQDKLAFCKRFAVAYGTIELSDGQIYGPGLLSNQEIADIQNMNSVEEVLSALEKRKLPILHETLLRELCDIFVGDDMENFNGATPAILANAYRAIRERAQNDSAQRDRLEKLAAYIDRESADCANSRGMIIGGKLVDVSNVADVYDGFVDMLNARREDLNESTDAEKIARIDANIEQLRAVIDEYDRNWGLDTIKPEDAKKYTKRWRGLVSAVAHAEMSPDTKNIAKRFKFLDADGQEIRQFREDGQPDRNGRLTAIFDLARTDTAKRHLAKVDEPINANELDLEINQDVLFKLQSMATTGDAIQMSMDDVEKLGNPEEFEKAVAEISAQKPYGGVITEEVYDTFMDNQVDSNAGWGARVKNKIGRFASKVRGFFGQYTQATSKIDALDDVRAGRERVIKRRERIQLLGGVLKGFASGLVACALIATIAPAAAAATGMTLAASLALIGGGLALGIITAQILRWRREQKEADKPATFREFRKNRKLITSIAVSAVASMAMGLAACGFATAAMAVGAVAMGVGMINNGIAAYERLKNNTNMGAAEKIAWVILNVIAPLVGGLAGRFLANSFINWYNQQHPENTLFQNKHTRTESHEVHGSREVKGTKIEYTQEALDNAERITKMWYRNDPQTLQARVDAIEAYNAQYGTNIDPYRAIMINGDAGGQTFDNMRLHVNNSHMDVNINDIHSHGHHRILTDAWGREYGYTHQELDAAAHLFNVDGTVNHEAMDVVMRLDGDIGAKNTVGYMSGRSSHNDNYLRQNDIARGAESSANGRVYSSYVDGEPAMVETEYTYQEPTTTTITETTTDFNRANSDAFAAYGNYTTQGSRTLRNRLGAFMDRARGTKAMVESRPVPQKPENNWTEDDVVPVVDDVDNARNDSIVPVYHKDEKQEHDDEIIPVPVHNEHEVRALNPGDEQRALPMAGGALVPATGGKLPTFDKIIGDNKDQIVIEAHHKKLLDAGRRQQHERVLRFGLTYQQAKDYNDLVQNIERETRKKNFDPKKITRWKQELQEMYNKYGRPDPVEYQIARNEAYAREEIDTKLLPQLDRVQAEIRGVSSEMSELLKQRPGSEYSEPGALAKWQKKYDKKGRKLETLRKQEAKVERKIKELGGLALLDTSDLYFPSPVKSESRRRKEEKWARLDAEKAERDAAAAEKAEKARAERAARAKEKTEAKEPEIFKPIEIQNPVDNFPTQENITPEPDQTAYAGLVGTVPSPVVPVNQEHGLSVVLDTPKEKEINVGELLQHREPVIAPKPKQISPKIGEIRGQEIKLLPVTYGNDYVAKNHGFAVVLADIGGVHVPFYLDNASGLWRPIYRLNRDGGLYLNDSKNQDHPKEIIYVAAMLGVEVGSDIPVDSLSSLDMEGLIDHIIAPISGNMQVYGTYPQGAFYAEMGTLRRALSHVGTTADDRPRLLQRLFRRGAGRK